jgi:hypothetical protein
MARRMSATDYLEGKLLDHVLAGVAYTPPSAWYMALHTADPGDTGTASEVSGGSYVAKPITFATHVGNTSASTGAVAFTAMPACTVTHYSIRDGLAGNVLFVGPLSASQTLTAGQTINFAAGQVTVTAD